ncbi:MAG: 4-coumarate--CoA ligase family protein [Roseiflexaceae bacterium]
MLFNSPYADVEIPNVPLTPFVLERMQAYGDKPALIDGPTDRTLTYRQLAGAIRLVASSLSKRGFGVGDVFAIYSPNLPEYAVAFHAVTLLGGTVTTLNPLYTVDEVTHQLNDAGAIYLLTISMFLENAKAAAARSNVKEIFTFDPVAGATPFAALLESDGVLPDIAFDPAEHLAVLPYSSGTTGLPKGVMLTHRNIVANIVQCEGITGVDQVSSNDSIVGVLPFFHIYGMVVIMNISLVRGATIVTMPRFDLEQFLRLVQKHKITRVNVVPPILVGLAKHPIVDQYDTSSLVELASGAAPLSAELTQAVMDRIGCSVMQGYGLTETSPVTHYYNRSLASTDKRASVGPLIPNTEAMVVEVVSGEPVAVGQPGEVLIRGPQVMKGYLNNPEATAWTLDKDGWLHTGDIGYADEEGFFYIVDRLKELIKYKGFQVAPAELEALLLSHPAVADVAVIPSPDEEAGEVPKAFVVRKAEVTADDLMAWVAERVSPQKKIRRLEFIDAIPKSLAGKILRRTLIEQERAG